MRTGYWQDHGNHQQLLLGAGEGDSQPGAEFLQEGGKLARHLVDEKSDEES